MTKFRDFGAPSSDKPAEPVTFRLYGEEFSCRPQVPGKVMLDLASRGGDEADAAANATVITDFFKAVMFPDSYDRFEALCNDPDRIVTIDSIMEIVSWLMEMYTSRPTQGPEALPAGH